MCFCGYLSESLLLYLPENISCCYSRPERVKRGKEKDRSLQQKFLVSLSSVTTHFRQGRTTSRDFLIYRIRLSLWRNSPALGPCSHSVHDCQQIEHVGCRAAGDRKLGYQLENQDGKRWPQSMVYFHTNPACLNQLSPVVYHSWSLDRCQVQF